MNSSNLFHKVYTYLQLFSNIVLLNILFIFSNFLFFSYLILLSKSITSLYLLPFYILEMTLPPTILALYQTIFDMFKNHDHFVLKNYFYNIKKHFNTSAIPLYLILYFMTNLILFMFLSPNTNFYIWLSAFCFPLIIFFTILTPYLVLEICIFQNTFFYTIINSVALTFHFLKLDIFWIIYILFAILISKELPSAYFLFTFSLGSYLFQAFYYSHIQKRISSEQKKAVI